MEAAEAYKVLGLNENATKEEIEKKYAMLCKRYKASLENINPTSERINIQKINQAYDIACRNIAQASTTDSTSETISSKKNIWSRYKALILGAAIVAAIVLIIFVVQFH